MIRSTIKLIGFSVKATDKTIGKAADFLFDQKSRKIEFIAVDADGLVKGKTAIVPFSKIKAISWEKATIELNIASKDLASGSAKTAFDPSLLETENAGYPPDLKFEESQKDIPAEGQPTEYAGDDNFTGGGQEELSPSGPGSKSSLDPGTAPEDEDHTAHAEERPSEGVSDLPEDKTLWDVDEKTGRPGRKHKPECKGDEGCHCDHC
ncbi:MAG: PRC-barrel domain-containing protein [Candidatus Omnitrophota bacterium]